MGFKHLKFPENSVFLVTGAAGFIGSNLCEAILNMGYKVKCAKNLFSDSWGYAASDTERADDLNELIRDESVRMVFFGGGEGADDVLPMLDFDAAKKDPKLYLSYSDGTTILNSIWAKTGIGVLYGQMPGIVPKFTEYNLDQFNRFVTGFPTEHIANTEWKTLTHGTAEGTLIGGYLLNFFFSLHFVALYAQKLLQNIQSKPVCILYVY